MTKRGPANQSGDAQIWHYTSLPALLSILKRRELWFTTVAFLEDPLECRTDRFYLRLDEQKQQDLLLAGAVHCWHLGKDSDLMWKVYAPSFGVAIQSTPERLKGSFCGPELDQVNCRLVEYCERNFGPADPFKKRRHFEGEREFRAYLPYEMDSSPSLGAGKVDGIPPPPAGRYVKIVPGTLIEEIWITPHEPEWFRKAVKDVIARYGSYRVRFRGDGKTAPQREPPPFPEASVSLPGGLEDSGVGPALDVLRKEPR